LRSDSPTYCRWYGVELSAEGHRATESDRATESHRGPEGHRALYLPPGVAHGYLTLADGTELLYQMGHRYVPEAARGVRWDDPAFGIEWPHLADELVISERDRSYPDFRRES
ncbi:MAG: dTDP-4-dehydrorhamnose 3,5-epimerase family protein, partial [Solirubrobacteraceae bacterium]